MNKSKMTVIVATIIVALLQSGVSVAGEGPYNGHTRNWFEKNPKAMAAQLNWCGNHGEEKNPMATTCVSAEDAQNALNTSAFNAAMSPSNMVKEYNEQFQNWTGKKEPYSGHTARWFESHAQALTFEREWCADNGKANDAHAITCVAAEKAQKYIDKNSVTIFP